MNAKYPSEEWFNEYVSNHWRAEQIFDSLLDLVSSKEIRVQLKLPPREDGTYEGLSWSEIQGFSSTYAVYLNSAEDHIRDFDTDLFYDEMSNLDQMVFSRTLNVGFYAFLEGAGTSWEDVISLNMGECILFFSRPLKFNPLVSKLQSGIDVVELKSYKLFDLLYDASGY